MSRYRPNGKRSTRRKCVHGSFSRFGDLMMVRWQVGCSALTIAIIILLLFLLLGTQRTHCYAQARPNHALVFYAVFDKWVFFFVSFCMVIHWLEEKRIRAGGVASTLCLGFSMVVLMMDGWMGWIKNDILKQGIGLFLLGYEWLDCLSVLSVLVSLDASPALNYTCKECVDCLSRRSCLEGFVNNSAGVWCLKVQKMGLA